MFVLKKNISFLLYSLLALTLVMSVLTPASAASKWINKKNVTAVAKKLEKDLYEFHVITTKPTVSNVAKVEVVLGSKKLLMIENKSNSTYTYDSTDVAYTGTFPKSVKLVVTKTAGSAQTSDSVSVITTKSLFDDDTIEVSKQLLFDKIYVYTITGEVDEDVEEVTVMIGGKKVIADVEDGSIDVMMAAINDTKAYVLVENDDNDADFLAVDVE